MGVKVHANLTMDNEVLERAKEKGLNISDVCEQALRVKTGEVVINPTHETCHKCSIKELKATADEPDKGMMWLWPDEKWICQRCFNRETKKVSITGKLA